MGKGRHRHEPAWWRDEHWQDQDGPAMSPWMKRRMARRRRHPSGGALFARFAAVMGLFAVLGCVVLFVLAAALMFLIPSRHTTDVTPIQPGLFWLPLLALFLLLLFALRRVGKVAVRRFADPLSETMRAADALASGDLSARAPVQGSPEFRHFARAFNRMAAALETADRQRRELLADVAHELRTPLTIVQGNLEGLRDGVYEATPEHLDLVLEETQKLGRLVEDLRLLTLAEAGQLPLDVQALDASQLLADVRDVFAPQAQEAGVELDVEVAAGLPTLLADPQRLGQVLDNLVANALRHTPAGGQVVLGAEGVDGGGPGQIRFWVTDTGEGIAEEDLPRIFDRFWRGDPARAHGAGAGSGLGLAIAKSLVEAHGGRIWAESDGVPGRGATVSFVVPLPPADGV
ncbi:MAG: HAMP domain-containing sensor histidine kinase [Anaerolineae bacterium]|jgi:two-component system OmpR family sensor kinase/two-component system sensor histidine kinase BaeS